MIISIAQKLVEGIVGKAPLAEEYAKNMNDIVEIDMTTEEHELCSGWHSGQSDPLYALASSGSIERRDILSAIGTLESIAEDNISDEDQEAANSLIDKLRAEEVTKEEGESEVEHALRVGKLVYFVDHSGNELTGTCVRPDFDKNTFIMKSSAGNRHVVQRNAIVGLAEAVGALDKLGVEILRYLKANPDADEHDIFKRFSSRSSDMSLNTADKIVSYVRKQGGAATDVSISDMLKQATKVAKLSGQESNVETTVSSRIAKFNGKRRRRVGEGVVNTYRVTIWVGPVHVEPYKVRLVRAGYNVEAGTENIIMDSFDAEDISDAILKVQKAFKDAGLPKPGYSEIRVTRISRVVTKGESVSIRSIATKLIDQAMSSGLDLDAYLDHVYETDGEEMDVDYPEAEGDEEDGELANPTSVTQIFPEDLFTGWNKEEYSDEVFKFTHPDDPDTYIEVKKGESEEITTTDDTSAEEEEGVEAAATEESTKWLDEIVVDTLDTPSEGEEKWTVTLQWNKDYPVEVPNVDDDDDEDYEDYDDEDYEDYDDEVEGDDDSEEEEEMTAAESVRRFMREDDDEAFADSDDEDEGEPSVDVEEGDTTFKFVGEFSSLDELNDAAPMITSMLAAIPVVKEGGEEENGDFEGELVATEEEPGSEAPAAFESWLKEEDGKTEPAKDDSKPVEGETGAASTEDMLKATNGQSAGDYDASYLGGDWKEALAKRGDEAKDEIYKAAYLVGWYASYEDNEVPASDRTALASAEKKVNPLLKKAGRVTRGDTDESVREDEIPGKNVIAFFDPDTSEGPVGYYSRSEVFTVSVDNAMMFDGQPDAEELKSAQDSGYTCKVIPAHQPVVEDESAADKFLGRPEVITNMSFGGTRFKYLHGIFINSMNGEEVPFSVYQAGSPKSKFLGRAKTLAAAKQIAMDKAEQVPGDEW